MYGNVVGLLPLPVVVVLLVNTLQCCGLGSSFTPQTLFLIDDTPLPSSQDSTSKEIFRTAPTIERSIISMQTPVPSSTHSASKVSSSPNVKRSTTLFSTPNMTDPTSSTQSTTSIIDYIQSNPVQIALAGALLLSIILLIICGGIICWQRKSMRKYYSSSAQPKPQSYTFSHGSLRILPNETAIYESMPDLRGHGTFRGGGKRTAVSSKGEANEYVQSTEETYEDTQPIASSAYEMDDLKSSGNSNNNSLPAAADKQANVQGHSASAEQHSPYELDNATCEVGNKKQHGYLVPITPPNPPQENEYESTQPASGAEDTEPLYVMDDEEVIKCSNNVSYSTIVSRNGSKSPTATDDAEPLYD